MTEKDLRYFENIANKLYLTLSKMYKQKKKKLSVYATKDDIKHDMIVLFLETGDRYYAERKTLEKYISLLSNIALERSFGDTIYMEAFIHDERDEDE